MTQSTVSRHGSQSDSPHTPLQSLLGVCSPSHGSFIILPYFSEGTTSSDSVSGIKMRKQREDEKSIWVEKATDGSGETEKWLRKQREERDGTEDYHGPCCPLGSVWHQFEPSCQWVLIMEDWQHCVAAGS